MGEGAIPLDLARTRLDEISDELRALDDRRQAAREAEEDQPDWTLLRNLPKTWAGLDLVSQKTILAATLQRIRLFGTYALLEYRIPIAPDGRTEARVHCTASTTRKNEG